MSFPVTVIIGVYSKLLGMENVSPHFKNKIGENGVDIKR